MSTGDGHNAPAQMALVQMADLAKLQQELERVRTMLEVAGVDSAEKGEYVEPGPRSERRYFSPEELADRLGWSKSKVYALSEKDIPRLKHGQLIRFHWAHVWAFEKKISWETADKIFRQDDAIQEASQQDVSNKTPVARVRHLS